MKKSESQKFESFKKRHNLTNSKIEQIISEYALTEDNYSGSFFCTKYNISKHVFYKLRDYAIIFMLVSRIICKKTRDKSIRNQISKNPTGKYNSAATYYRKLIIRRREYLDSFSNEEIVQIALMYANSGNTLQEIATAHGISTETARRLIAIALVNRLVDEETYRRIKIRSDRILINLRGPNILSAESLWHSYNIKDE